MRLCRSSDAQAVREFFLENTDHFGPWEPKREPDYDTMERWKPRIEKRVREHEAGTGAFFISIDEKTDEMVAMCNINNIIREAFQSCYMGFGVSRKYQGTGCMHDLCQVAIEHAFTVLQLHRIMANHMLANERSANLLKRLGFEQEGFAKSYLKINGRWEDHVMTALINSD